jgi:hypothetical protein
MQSSPFPRYLVPPRPKYSPQRPIVHVFYFKNGILCLRNAILLKKGLMSVFGVVQQFDLIYSELRFRVKN